MRVLYITAIVVLIDQVTKVVVRSSMYLGQSIPVLGDWFKLTFTQNPGMAFGISFGPRMLVTVLSVIITVLLIAYLWRVRSSHLGYRACLALILGGAVGNIIDRVFYGRIFGYGDLFHGKVVDFIHFDIWRGNVAEWVPVLGGDYLALFPIWNVADMAIVTGVIAILVFQKKFDISESGRTSSSAELAAEGTGNGMPAEDDIDQVSVSGDKSSGHV